MKRYGYEIIWTKGTEFGHTDYETYDKVTARRMARECNKELIRQWGYLPVKYKAVAYK